VKVGVLGTGDVGKALARGMLLLGHEVMLSGREDNEAARAWAREAGEKARSGSFADAAAFCEIAFLATKGMATEDALRMAGVEHFAGKTVVDATNPLDGMPPALAISGNDSLGERVQRLLTGAHVVKAFNTVGNPLFVHPQLPAKPDMFIAGNDDGARAEIANICEAWGWGVVDLGGIESSRYLEAIAMAWIVNGLRNGAWNAAFKMVT
jgi:8-hydroxy-5-deazaflavin:NADPH oxidoreductase